MLLFSLIGWFVVITGPIGCVIMVGGGSAWALRGHRQGDRRAIALGWWITSIGIVASVFIGLILWVKFGSP